MSTIGLTLTTTTVTATGVPLTLVASVTNSASVPARIVLGAFGSAEGQPGAREWTAIERPVREVAAGATEQYTITITPPAEAPAGEHPVRFIAYDSDRPPEEYSDQARQVKVVVPARPATPAATTPWWIWVAAAALLVVVGVVAYLVLRPQDEPPLPSPSPSPSVVTPTPSPSPSPSNTLKIPTKIPTKIATPLPTKLVPTQVPTAIAPPGQP